MTSFYTPISAKIPENFTKPTRSFTKHVWLSIFGLLFFIVMYLVLMIWFGRLAYHIFVDANEFGGHFLKYVLAIGFGFLSLFMAKSLILFNKREKDPTIRYITKEEEPLLFDFLYNLSDEAGAPRPHKVFLSNRVNASVSYDLSLINLIFPSKKNLEIGLGLVNILNLGEFKAVLAHEFGHFAQRSMLLGRYVYIAQQIAHKIVNKRDIFDSFLSGLSGFDLRIAWVGWILSILVWSIRSIIEIFFSIVVVAERALSREMEFQADLVAVSLTGSDALIHALYKLQIADEAYQNALDEMNLQLRDKRAVDDMFALQSNYVEKMAKVLDKPTYGKSPSVPETNPENHRIFTSRKYNPPQMWSTHPADIDRENNAKRIYISEPIDNRSSWDLFSDSKKYREEMTDMLIKTAKTKTTDLEIDIAIAQQDKRHFNWLFLDSKYHSAFLHRFPFLNFDTVEEIFEADEDFVITEQSFETLYPKTLNEDVNLLNELLEEREALTISKNESVTLEKRVIWHRGNQIKRRDIDEVIASIEKEEKELRTKLKAHDKRCRLVHVKAAEKLNAEWVYYLKKLTALTHYAEHSITNINDVARKYNNTLSIALADGKVSSSELVEIMNVCNDYHNVLRRIYKHPDSIQLSSELLKNMKIESYKSSFEEFKLPPPSKENINDWTQVVASWANSAIESLQNLRNEALELLLETEDKIKTAYLNSGSLTGSPEKIVTVLEYDKRTPGTERKIQRKLGFWDRFFIGDGIVPSVMKFAVAGGILFASLYYGSYSQKLPVYLYNGLNTYVDVSVDNATYIVPPKSNVDLKLSYGKDYTIVTKTRDGHIIENIDVSADEHSSYIYNVGAAATFVSYPVYYGYEGDYSTDFLGAKRWFPAKGDHVLEEPPSSISTSSSSSGAKRDVVQVYNDMPSNLLSIVEDPKEQNNMIIAHSLWDPPYSEDITSWLHHLNQVENGLDIVSKRLEIYPDELESMRASQDLADSISKVSICEKHTHLSENNPDNANYYYLATRCIEDEKAKNTAFIKGYERWPDHDWLAYASSGVYAENEKWNKAMDAFKVVIEKNKGLANIVGADMLRVNRIVNAMGSDYEFPLMNEDIAYYQALETGNIDGGELNQNYVFYLINEGKLEEAFELSKQFPESEAYFLRLLAASEDSADKVKDRLQQFDAMDGINLNSVWCTIGLNIKKNESYSEYLEFFKPFDFENGFMEKLIDYVKSKNIAAIENHVKDLGIRWKAEAYLMAVVAWNYNIPQKWKSIIDKGLYANEKPYLNL
ncbi:M48 family metallopeptidase [Winogradskyella sp.]|uniref:M48 family metallopeptidase n=1 Tax=Winogradskyella sp. TaxID=1883156 RepID=UPI003BAA1814